MREEIARLVHEKFAQLPRKGKPASNEWSVLAGVVAETVSGDLEVLVVTTGLKCLGSVNYEADGSAVHDSHAEVLARRAMVSLLLDDIALLAAAPRDGTGDNKKTVLLERNPDKAHNTMQLRRRSDIKSLCLYISQTPCGDASIFPAKASQVLSPHPTATAATTGSKRKLDEDEDNVESQDSGATTPSNVADGDDWDDLQRTGAKCVPDGPQDPMEDGVRYHVTGALRIKPGRGHPTQSLSCSDKIARWCILGFQGAMVARWTGPLYFDSIVVGAMYDQAALHRAVHGRLLKGKTTDWAGQLPAPYRLHAPAIVPTTLRAPCDRTLVGAAVTAASATITAAVKPVLRTADAAIVWAANWPVHQAVVKGRIQGASPKNGVYPRAARSRICRLELFGIAVSAEASDASDATESESYEQFKQAATDYQKAKRIAIDQGPLHGWIEQPNTLMQFHYSGLT